MQWLISCALWLSLVAAAPAWATIQANKSFSPVTINAYGTSTLIIILSNDVATPALNASMADNLPTNVQLSSAVTSNSCLGTLSNELGNPLAAGDTKIRLANGTIPAGAPGAPVTCSVSFVVTNLVPNESRINTIVAGSVSTSLGDNSLLASATLNTNPLQPIAAIKTVAPNFIHGGGTATYTIRLSNPNLITTTGVAFVDSLPANLSITNAAAVTNSCGGAVVNNLNTILIDGNSGIRLNGGQLNPNTPCTVSFQVFAWNDTVAANGNVPNTLPSNITNSLGLLSNASSVNISLQTGAANAKSFAPTLVTIPGTSLMSVTANNRNLASVSNATLTDTLPAGMTIAGVPVASAGCGGLVNFTTAAGGPVVVGSTSVRMNNFDIPAAANANGATGACNFTVPVQITSELVYNNLIPASRYGPTLPFFPAVNALLTGIADIFGTKAFIPNTRVSGGTTSLVITLTNFSAAFANVVAFTDRLTSMSPSGSFTVAAPGNITSNCGGTVTSAVGSTSFTLTGGGINGLANCQITVPIAINTATVAGNFTNSIPIGSVSSGIGANAYAFSGVLTVQNPLTVTKTFVPSTIAPGNTSLLTINIIRNLASGAPDLTGLAYTDTLPIGMTVAASPNLTNNCGGTAAADPGGGTVTLSGGLLTGLANSCVVRVSVQSSVSVTNTIAIGAVTSAQGISNRAIASAALTIGAGAPNVILNKEFIPDAISGGGVARLRIIVNNNASGAIALTGVNLNDVFPGGGTPLFAISSAPSPGVTGAAGCAAGSYNALPGSTTFSIFNASVPAGGSCAFAVNVISAYAGSHNNVIPANALTSAQGATNDNIASKSLIVNLAFNIGKSFSPNLIGIGQQSTLSLVILNTTNDLITGSAPMFRDVMPAQVTVTGPLSTDCTGAGITATAAVGGRTVTVSGGVYPSNSLCTVYVPVISNTTGAWVNSIPAGSVSTVNGIANSSGTTDTLVVLGKPIVQSKTFVPSSIASGGVSVVTITLNNPNTAANFPSGLTGASFTDNLVGMVVAGAQTVGGSCTNAGTNFLNDGDTTVNISNLTMPAGNCTIIFNVTGNTAGTWTNTITGVTTIQTGTPPANAVSATLSVLFKPSIAKEFTTTNLELSATSSLIITLTNPNNATLTLGNPAFTDLFPTSPAQMSLADTATTSSCIGGSITNSLNTALAIGNVGIRFNNGAIAPLSSCSLSVVVNANAPGTYTNVSSVLASTNAGSSTMTANAQLVYVQPTADLRISKTDGISTVLAGGTTAYTLTMQNLGPYPADNTLVKDPAATGLICTSINCDPADALAGAVCPVAGVALWQLSIGNLQTNGIRIPTFPAGSSLKFVVNCDISATGR
jgi:uncharacterized repeat protein (TIGR01451 family)